MWHVAVCTCACRRHILHAQLPAPPDPASQPLARYARYARPQDDTAATSSIATSFGAAPSGAGQLDEEGERQLWTLRIELACLQALDARAALQQEVRAYKKHDRALVGEGVGWGLCGQYGISDECRVSVRPR